MKSRYIPHSDEDIKRMLEVIGVESIDDLYADIPDSLKFKGEYAIPEGMTEIELRRHFKELDAKNREMVIFAGGGAYDHYSPAVISHLLQRSEFYTAYTPYQPEISQGTLQYIFEYQSMICDLTGMEVSNASMYDGATAAAESVMMMVASARKKNRVLVSATVLDNYLEVIKTYARFHGIELTIIPEKDGITDLDALKAELSAGDVAGALLPQPNKYGIVEDLTGVADALHGVKALMAMCVDPSTLAVLRTPGEWGADIACGDGQSLGMPLQFGGPWLGFMACKESNMRKLPGRIVGATVDRDGKRCYVLTLQAREQHIRREKATSNICSNQSLMALYATIYIALLGPKGLKEVNELAATGAHYLYNKLIETGKFKDPFTKPFLKEFTLQYDGDADILMKKAADKGVLAGTYLGDGLIRFAVTEKRTREEIDTLVEILTEK